MVDTTGLLFVFRGAHRAVMATMEGRRRQIINGLAQFS